MTVKDVIELDLPRAGEVFIINNNNHMAAHADAWYHDNILAYLDRTVDRIGYYPDNGTLHIKLK